MFTTEAERVLKEIKESIKDTGPFFTIIIKEDMSTGIAKVAQEEAEVILLPSEVKLEGIKHVIKKSDNRILVHCWTKDACWEVCTFKPENFVKVTKSSTKTLSEITDSLMFRKKVIQSEYDELVGLISLINFQTIGVTPREIVE